MYRLAPDETHCMIDLETLGTRPGSVILQIGAVRFKPCADPGTEIQDQRKWTLHIENQRRYGFTIDGETIAWWMRQSDDARALFAERDVCPLKDALEDLSAFATGLGIWSHGASFDIPMLEEAYKRYGLRAPWHHKAVRDTRTLFWLQEPKWPNNQNKHDALADAMCQALAVCDSLRKLGAVA